MLVVIDLKPTTHQIIKKLANSQDIELREESKRFILDIAVSLSAIKKILKLNQKSNKILLR